MKSVRSPRKQFKMKHALLLALTWIPVLVTLVVLLFLIGVSFMDAGEANNLWVDGISSFHVLPVDFSTENWKEVLYNTPEYLLHFWNSVWISAPVVIGSVAISVLTGYGLCFLKFRGKRLCILAMIVLMLLPYQVTLTPNLLMFDALGMIGSRLAVILPNIFHPLGMVAMTYFMGSVSQETMEAARMDGASEWQLFARIAVPQVKGGIAILTLYSFLDAWNMVEPILVLIQDAFKYPLSIALRSFSDIQPGISAACSVLFVIPALLIFGMSREQLTEGLIAPKKE